MIENGVTRLFSVSCLSVHPGKHYFLAADGKLTAAPALHVRPALGSMVNLHPSWLLERFTWTPPGTDTGRGQGHIWLANVDFFLAFSGTNSPNSSLAIPSSILNFGISPKPIAKLLLCSTSGRADCWGSMDPAHQRIKKKKTDNHSRVVKKKHMQY